MYQQPPYFLVLTETSFPGIHQKMVLLPPGWG